MVCGGIHATRFVYCSQSIDIKLQDHESWLEVEPTASLLEVRRVAAVLACS